jgi:hypothetical protein
MSKRMAKEFIVSEVKESISVSGIQWMINRNSFKP